jgi:hypothetical protein
MDSCAHSARRSYNNQIEELTMKIRTKVRAGRACGEPIDGKI